MRRRAKYDVKVREAAMLLLFRRHRLPGAKGWELRKRLGADYHHVVSLLNDYLDKLGLQVKTVFEDEEVEKPTQRDLDRARFFVTAKSPPLTEEKLCGWRIDDVAALAIAISMIASKGGRLGRREIENFLKKKLPSWRANLDRFVQQGYLNEDGEGNLQLGWRTKAEVDVRSFLDLLIK
ncbi:TPA: hypothetical protein EYP44_00575 [Candidatus Bathyarchaeota archaeon]|nr:hypothetical protein [Candidatus Bathyarchaeota archaeon]